MDQWTLIDSAKVPGTNSTMLLMQRGQELVIQVDGHELMGNRVHGSEDALADLACDRLCQRPDARVLIGGLGIGFTAAAALRRLGPGARVVVAELVPEVIEWNRGVLGEAAGHPVLDPRLALHAGDVADLIRQPPAPWDAILLDVDNTPTSLTRNTNTWLYTPQGLAAASKALRPAGVLGVWSAASDAAFTNRLQRAGFAVETITVRARGAKGGAQHVVWLATR